MRQAEAVASRLPVRRYPQLRSCAGPAATVIAFVLLVLAAFALMSWPAGGAEAAARGIVDNRLARSSDPAVVDPIIADMQDLRARWTRIIIDWSALQPTAPTATDPGYSTAYLDRLKFTLARLHAAGINVILTPYLVPRWASNEALWNSPPPGYTAGQYRSFYIMKTSDSGVMTAYREMCAYLAQTFSAEPYGVKHYQCYNEPNLYLYWYPQARPGQPSFGVDSYLSILKQFYRGVKSVDGKLTVIAGATAPWGGNDDISTSPQRFAGYLKDNGGAAFFDAYSHHPYPLSGYPPEQLPYDPSITVTLSNLDDLLDLFPNKPFYLTEFGYSTIDTTTGLTGVGETNQARYLRQAYAMVAKKRQVKVMLWFLLQDVTGTGLGVERMDGTRKPSWYALAGRTEITAAAPARVAAAEPFAVIGTLTSDGDALGGKPVVLETRTPAQSAWGSLRTVTTRRDGSFRFADVKQSRSRYYRVRWSGVCESKRHLVSTR